MLQVYILQVYILQVQGATQKFLDELFWKSTVRYI